MMNALETFRDIFWDAFHRPKLFSPTMKAIWEELEPINDLLAGPFYAIYDQGNCQYVFKDQHLFAGIHHPDDLLNWCVELIEQYRKAVESVDPESEEEISDRKILLFQTDMKMELADLARMISMEALNKTT